MGLNQLTEFERGWMEAVMECFEENQVLGLGKGDEIFGLGLVGCGGFLEEDMFSGFEGFACPFVVEAVGEGVVDAVDFWVRNEGVVGGVCVWDPVLVRKSLFMYIVFPERCCVRKRKRGVERVGGASSKYYLRVIHAQQDGAAFSFKVPWLWLDRERRQRRR